MNIVQLHEKVKFWVDVVATQRFESEDYDNAINTAISDLVREKAPDHTRLMNRSDTFQRNDRIRQELRPLVMNLRKFTHIDVQVVGTTFRLEFTSVAPEIRQILSLKIQDEDSTWYNCYPLTYDRKNIINHNPFRTPRVKPSPKIYYIERTEGYDIVDNGLLIGIDDVEMSVLKEPTYVQWGTEYSTPDIFSIGDVLYCLTDVVYNGNNYYIGDPITIVAGALQITSGEVLGNYTDTDLPAMLHEEIARRAAVNVLNTANQYEKARSLMQEILST
jgi:hypothetical protein